MIKICPCASRLRPASRSFVGPAVLLASLLTLFVGTPVAQAKPPVCKLTETIGLMAKPAKNTRKAVVKRRTHVALLEIGDDWTQVKTKYGSGYMATSWLSQVCRPWPRASNALGEEPPPELSALPSEASPKVPTAVGTGSDGPADDQFRGTYKIKLAVMDLEGSEDSDRIPADMLGSLTQTVTEALDTLGPFTAISSQDIARMLTFESNRQLLGCDDVNCLAEIGGALGADFLVTGKVTDLKTRFVVQMQLVNIRKAAVENRVSRDHVGDAAGLFDELKLAAKSLMRQVLGERAGTLALQVTEEGATIRVDGSIVGVSPLDPITLPGGPHTVTVEKQGFVINRQDVTIDQDRETEVAIALQPSAEFVRSYKEDAGLMRGLAWTAIGIGGAGILSAGALYWAGRVKTDELNQTIRNYNQKDPRPSDQAERLAKREREIATFDTLAVTAGTVGAVALGVGAVLWVIGGDPDRYDASPSLSAGSPPLIGGVSVQPDGSTMAVLSGQF